MTTPPVGLDSLRTRIDELDRQLIEIVAARLRICEEVAALKEGSDTPVIQPTRVRQVITTRRQSAIEAGIDPDFAEQLFRVLLTETHRIEIAKGRTDAAPDKTAAPLADRSGLDTVAARIDHVVVAVEDIDAACELFIGRLGFHDEPLADGDSPGIRVVEAGGVTVVLVSRIAGDSVARHLDRHGSGVQHIAIEVLNAGYARTALAALDAPLLTEVVVDANGLEQFFTVQDSASGVQLGFVARTGHRVGFGASNVHALFDNLT